MRSDYSTGQLLRRLSLWGLAQALPHADALKAPVRRALTSVMVASAAGTLMAIAIVAALAELCVYLQNQGLSTGASLALVGGIGALLAVVAYFAAQRMVDRIPGLMSEVKLFTPHHDDLLGDLFNIVVGRFLDGVREESPRSRRKEKTREQLEEALEAMIAKLAVLEADAEVDVDEDEAKVVLELKRHAPRSRKRKS